MWEIIVILIEIVANPSVYSYIFFPILQNLNPGDTVVSCMSWDLMNIEHVFSLHVLLAVS